MTVLHQISSEHKDRLVHELGESLAQRPEVLFACVHGSFLLPAVGFRDIDIGVWLDAPAAQGKAALDYQWDLDSLLERKFPYPMDVRVLNNASLGFKHAASGGRLLTAKDTVHWFDFRERTWNEYLDFAPLARQSLLDLLSGPF